jgi:type VI secretion system secreted protein VgrG
MDELLEPQSSNLVIANSSGDEFVVTSMSVTEGLSELSVIEVDVLCQDVDPEDWVGDQVTCSLYSAPGDSRSSVREYSGYVVAVNGLTQTMKSRSRGMKLTIKPWLALLAYSSSCRVFQEVSTQDIVTSIFDELGFSGCYTINSMPTSTREYCLQYNESDLEFVSRLLAEEGVHYYFDADADSGQMILQDASNPFSKDDIVTLDHAATPSGENDLASLWERQNQIHSASIELAAYDYNQSKLITSGAQSSKYTLSGNTKLTQYRFPASSITGAVDDLSSPLAVTERAQLDSNYTMVKGRTDTIYISAGRYVEMGSHPNSDQEGNYLTVRARYQFDANGTSAFDKEAEFICVPEAHLHYPQRKEKPVIHGLQTAVVAGTTDDEPAADESGRVRIKFPWDTETGDSTSCWVRVAQPMAGNGYGFQFLPRAGHEVLVSFINGDPDQPVVVSSVYNSTHKPPYPTLNTTESGIKTQQAGESNEIRFDDKADAEAFYTHAAKDYTNEVVNDSFEIVGNEKSVAVTQSITQTADVNFSVSAKENIELTAEKAYTLTATDSISEDSKEITLTASDTLKLVVGDSEIVMSSSSIDITSGSVTISGSSSISIEGGSLSQSGTSVSIDSDAAMDLSAGTNLTAKATATLTAQGLNATLQGDVGATVTGAATAEISSDGIATVSGGIVMVN